MGGIADAVGGFVFGDDDVSDAPEKAAKRQVEFQREALNYLKEREALPRQFSEEALTQLGGLYGLEGGEGSQQMLIDQAIQSPLYQAIMGGREMGEEAIMRQAAATGGLRSGDVQASMYDYNTQLQNRALLESYNQQLMGLQGLAGLPSNAGQIAQMISGIGTTQAQGILGGAQTEAAQQQGTLNTLLGIGSIAAMFSDRRLKKNICLLGKVNGHNFYSFDWNSIANKLGLEGSTCGCMAEEVYAIDPNAVFIKDNFMMVNYTKIGVL